MKRGPLGTLVLLTACQPLPGDSAAPATGGTYTSGDAPTQPQKALQAGDRLELRTELDLTLGALAPDPGYQILSQLHDDPGEALFDLADAAGVPAASALYGALPDSLSSRVSGWLGDAIDSSELAALVQWSQIVVTTAEIDSSMTITAVDGDVGRAEHVLRYVTLQVDGARRVAVPQLEGFEGAGHSELDFWVDSDDVVVFGEQRFGLLLGEAAYRAFDSAVQERYGGSLRETLGMVVDCGGAAEEVANQCILGVCVGHESDLRALCEGALDAAEERIHEEFRRLDLELLNLVAGEAERDALGLRNGTWQAEAELGIGMRTLPARFTGTLH
jgi:hypothetical protein